MSKKGGAPPPIVLETLENVRKIRDAWQADDTATVLRIAPSLFEKTSENVQETVYRIYADSLIHESQFERVLQVLQDKKLPKSVKDALSTAHVYALYRLDRYTEAHDMAKDLLKNSDVNSADAVTLEHMLAQCLYRTGQIKAAREAYVDLSASMTNDAQIATNLVATHVANATPFAGPPSQGLLLSESLKSQLETNDGGKNAYPYELAYNLSTKEILTGLETGSAIHRLEIALKQAEAQTADLTEAERMAEIAPLRCNLDWARVFWQGGTTDANAIPMKHMAASGKMVALVNRALDMPKASDGLRLLPLDTSKLTPMQARFLTYNRAILQYKANQLDECMETCRQLQSSLSKDGSSNKQKGMTTAPDTKVESLWWEARATVLQVRAQLGKGGNKYNRTTAEQTLQSLLQALRKQSETSIRDHAIAYVECHKASILHGDGSLSADERLALLQSLPDSWKTKRAVVATMAALYQQKGQSQKATELVKETGHEDALANLLLSQGQYSTAVELYESADLTDPIAQARYTRALTYCDPDKAMDYWNKVRPASVLDDPDVASPVDGAELELRPVPRLRSTSPRHTVTQPVAESDGTQNGGKPKKSHESVLRRRARKREAYLAELDRKGLRRSAVPDPERWLPKYERSYNRRRRNKGGAGTHKGAQGGVSDKDAAQLDVAARQAARAAGETSGSTSTAHIAAVSSGGPRKGGRRR